MSCGCGGHPMAQKAARQGLVLRWQCCGACGKCGRFALWAAGVRLTGGEVARRLFNDEAMTERLICLARRRQEQAKGLIPGSKVLTGGVTT